MSRPVLSSMDAVDVGSGVNWCRNFVPGGLVDCDVLLDLCILPVLQSDYFSKLSL